MLLDELSILVLEVIKCSALIATLLLGIQQDLLNPLDLGHVELLVEGVEGGTTLSPVLGLPRGGGLIGLALRLPSDSFFDGGGPLFL